MKERRSRRFGVFKLHIQKYVGTSQNIIELRKICLAWQSFGFWSFDEVLCFLENKNHILFFFTQSESEWVGAALFTTNLDQSDLVYIFVKPDLQKRGHGFQLLKACVDELNRSPGVTKFFLEVRTDNERAISLYIKFGFKKIGERPSYYHDGSDALVMKWERVNDN